MTDFVVFAPNFTISSAGKRCLHELADDLVGRGLCASICGPEIRRPGAKAPPISLPEARRGYGTVAIYPETVEGNPLRSLRVARWCLNRPGLGGDERFPETDRVFWHTDAIEPFILGGRKVGKLHLPTLDSHIFYPPPPGSTREGLAFYKGKHLDADPHEVPGVSDGLEITRSWPSHEELGPIFRRVRALVTFDDFTALTDEARACDCPVVISKRGPLALMDDERVLDCRDLGRSGVGWWLPGEHIETSIVRAGVPREVSRRLETVRMEYQEQLTQLIEEFR